MSFAAAWEKSAFALKHLPDGVRAEANLDPDALARHAHIKPVLALPARIDKGRRSLLRRRKTERTTLTLKLVPRHHDGEPVVWLFGGPSRWRSDDQNQVPSFKLADTAKLLGLLNNARWGSENDFAVRISECHGSRQIVVASTNDGLVSISVTRFTDPDVIQWPNNGTSWNATMLCDPEDLAAAIHTLHDTVDEAEVITVTDHV